MLIANPQIWAKLDREDSKVGIIKDDYHLTLTLLGTEHFKVEIHYSIPKDKKYVEADTEPLEEMISEALLNALEDTIKDDFENIRDYPILLNKLDINTDEGYVTMEILASVQRVPDSDYQAMKKVAYVIKDIDINELKINKDKEPRNAVFIEEVNKTAEAIWDLQEFLLEQNVPGINAIMGDGHITKTKKIRREQ